MCQGLSGETLPQTLGECCQSVGEVRYATVYMDPATLMQVELLRKAKRIYLIRPIESVFRLFLLSLAEDSGRSNGTGKVDFDSRETAQRAIRELNGSTLDGVQITVQSLADVPSHLWSLGLPLTSGP
eukprot:Skav217512  [mRNA]  locus=scaffold647:48899:49279:+ [translate_table: standard]